jgi:hypothetical protein
VVPPVVITNILQQKCGGVKFVGKNYGVSGGRGVTVHACARTTVPASSARRYGYAPNGLKGERHKKGEMPADANKDGKVTQNELFLYIRNREEDDENFINQNVQTYPLDSDYVLFVK